MKIEKYKRQGCSRHHGKISRALAIIGKTTAAGGTGYVVEFCGEAITDLAVEGRRDVLHQRNVDGKAGLIAQMQRHMDR
ncbi:hypothetical protein O9929_01960 [Vibrio lentus]|nr:hypothetical protein [Vibrio lentus]